MAIGLGPYIRQRRADLGMSQIALSEASGVTRSHLSMIEHGKIAIPSADIRRRLAAALGISHLDLLVAAGELTADELQIANTAGVVSDSPYVADLVEMVRAVPWAEARAKFIEAVIGEMLALDARGKG